jgi:glycosyltransferase involved in cell wall biosynthesis
VRICILANARVVHTQRWARAFAERGHEVVVLSIRGARIPDVQVRTVCVGPVNSASSLLVFLSYLKLALTVRRHLRRVAPDVLNAHYTTTHGVIAACSGFSPRVVSCWGSDVNLASGSMRGLRRWLNLYALRRPDLVCSTSRFMIEQIHDLLGPGVPVRQVPFGVDCARFRPMQSRGQTAEFRVGFVKALAPLYGPDLLVRAMRLAVDVIPHARLVMVGEGPLGETLDRMVSELGLKDHVEFLGRVPNPEVPHVMTGFDVLVNCSHAESFGVVVLEASACGIPVVATEVGGVPEVCRHGESGLLVPPNDVHALADAIIRLARDPELRAAMGRAGRTFVLQNYAWQNDVDRMLGLLEDLVSETGEERVEADSPDRSHRL